MFSPLHDLRRYTCPGEPGDISRSIHLARLAASYAKCRVCPARREAGGLNIPESPAPNRDAALSLRSDELLRTATGFRGIYLNHLDRTAAITWAAALGALLWEDDDGVQGDALRSLAAPMRHTAPTVVIGYDDRPAAPDILTGAALGLQRMSCQVIDIGMATEPCVAFAVHHLSADAGLYVTGSGCDPAWIGFDLRRRHGLPPETHFLQRWQEIGRQPSARPSRRGGSLRPFPMAALYEANLWKHFHALRPLHAVIGTTSQQMAARLERIFSRLAGRMHAVRLPVRRRDLNNANDVDVQQVGQAVREHRAHLGAVIDEDGLTCGFLNERGELVDALQVAALIIRHLLRDHGGGDVVLTPETWDNLAPAASAHGGQPLLASSDECAARLLAANGLLAVGGNDRFWFGGDSPACDAVITLAVVMQALSLSDAEFSRVGGP